MSKHKLGEVCVHNKLRRQCDICDMEKENATLREQVRLPREEVEARRDWQKAEMVRGGGRGGDGMTDQPPKVYPNHAPPTRPPLPETFPLSCTQASYRGARRFDIPVPVARELWRSGYMAGWAAAHRTHET